MFLQNLFCAIASVLSLMVFVEIVFVALVIIQWQRCNTSSNVLHERLMPRCDDRMRKSELQLNGHIVVMHLICMSERKLVGFFSIHMMG